MKKLIYSLLFAVSALFLSISISYAQCEPDTITCKDTLLPGEFCPRLLPDGFVGQPYSEVITIIPPGQFTHPDFGTVDIQKIIVTDVKNMPHGIGYEANAPAFFPDTAYCVLLSGTPDTAGVYNLGITVTAYVDLGALGIIAIEGITDDTSVSITIHAGSGLDDAAWEEQFVICGPNPFNNTTMISMKSSGIDDAELVVYNLLGSVVYREQMRASSGINRFRFDGQDLRHGTYIYHVSTKDKIYTNRLLKLKD
jgi:hypothetical protein